MYYFSAILNQKYDPHFPLMHQQKDLRLALLLGDKVEQPLYVASAANEVSTSLEIFIWRYPSQWYHFILCLVLGGKILTNMMLTHIIAFTDIGWQQKGRNYILEYFVTSPRQILECHAFSAMFFKSMRIYQNTFLN